MRIGTASDDMVLLTGCDSGIGLEMAKHIHATTDYTIMCGFLNLSPATKGYQQLHELTMNDCKKRLIFKKLDITSDKDVNALKESIDELIKTGRIKYVAALINNSGMMTYGEFDWLTWEQIQKQVDVNLLGTLRLTRYMIPYIIQSKGRIINVSSVTDATVLPGSSVYSATKIAISVFSRGLGYELRKFGVHVVTLRLGDFARLTNILKNHAAHREEMWNAMDDDKRHRYGDFFNQFHDHLMENYGMTSPSKFEDSNLFEDLDSALLTSSPPYVITCAPWTFRLFYSLVEIMPTWIQYLMLDFLLQFGFKWKPRSQVDM